MMTETTPTVQYFMLNNGNKMPALGLGGWMGAGETGLSISLEACKNALKFGYRHIDTASVYNNEEQVGIAIRESGIPRHEIFVTTKLWNTHHDRVREAFEESLAKLNVEYIDLYLMHWPQTKIGNRVLPVDEHPNFIDTWKDMEKLLETGKVKNIGVSNFSIKNLELLLPHCTVVPVTNQVQLHPCLPQFELQEYCEAKGIILTAYSPFGQSNPLFFKDPDFIRIAEAHKANVGQVALSWTVQRGVAVVPKSANPERLKSNLQLFQLTPEEMDTINGLHKKPGMHRSLLVSPGGMLGWTYEQLGWAWGPDGYTILQ